MLRSVCKRTPRRSLPAAKVLSESASSPPLFRARAAMDAAAKSPASGAYASFSPPPPGAQPAYGAAVGASYGSAPPPPPPPPPGTYYAGAPSQPPAYYASAPPLPSPSVVVYVADDEGKAPGSGADAAGLSYSAFMDRKVRQGFIAKVYAILTAQLTATFAIVAAFVFSPSLADFVRANPVIMFVAIIANFVLMIALVCFRNNARRVPLNYILLAAFTLTMAVMVGAISSNYETASVLIAAGICVSMTAVLSLFACQTRVDFTAYLGCAIVALWSLLIFGLLAGIFFRSNVLSVVYAALGAALFGFFIVIDTQMIVGGSHAVKFSTDEYIFAACVARRGAAQWWRPCQPLSPPSTPSPPRLPLRLPRRSLNLYLDIINLFLYLLRLFGVRRVALLRACPPCAAGRCCARAHFPPLPRPAKRLAEPPLRQRRSAPPAVLPPQLHDSARSSVTSGQQLKCPLFSLEAHDSALRLPLRLIAAALAAAAAAAAAAAQPAATHGNGRAVARVQPLRAVDRRREQLPVAIRVGAPGGRLHALDQPLARRLPGAQPLALRAQPVE